MEDLDELDGLDGLEGVAGVAGGEAAEARRAAGQRRQRCLGALGAGREAPRGKTLARRLAVAARAPDVRYVGDGAPDSIYHDYQRPAIRAYTGALRDYDRGDFREGRVEQDHLPKLLPADHLTLGVVGAAHAQKIEPTMTALDRESLDFAVEAHERGDPASNPQARVPLLVVRPRREDRGDLQRKEKAEVKRRPCIVFCHDAGKAKEEMIPRMEAAARRGYVAAAIDARYHGGRAETPSAYKNALLRSVREASRKGQQKPAATFLLDTVHDLVTLVDYLELREDVDPARIGVTGVGIGGMHAWLLATADARVACTATLMGCLSLRWSLENDMWQEFMGVTKSTGYLDLALPTYFGQERVMDAVMQAAAKQHGAGEANATLAESVLGTVAPGLIELFDLPVALELIAPRPICILGGELDDRFPIEGVEDAVDAARGAYELQGVPDALVLRSFENVQSTPTPEMHIVCDDFLDRYLLFAGRDPEKERERLAPTEQAVTTVGTFDEKTFREMQARMAADAYEVSGEWV